jgi:uncharacterized membrane protein
MKLSRWLMFVLIAAFFVLALALYGRMPEPMASHWNAVGDVDGYISRFWGVFLLPFTVVGLTLLLSVIPAIDPLRANIERFRETYDWFVVVFLGYMLYIYIMTLLWNLGVRFDFGLLLVPAMAGLFFFIGVLVERARRNYFIGIRTPWTLANDEVWNRTHKLGGTLFKASAVLILLGLFWPDLIIWFIMVPVFLAAIVSIVASYLFYRQVERGA